MDFDLAIIGSGPAGYVAALRAAQLGKKVVCIEKDKTLGGTCLNVGCIPSKALLHSSHLFETCQHSLQENGIFLSSLSFQLDKMMQRKEKIVSSFTKGISFLFNKSKITSLEGTASFVDEHTLLVNEEKVHFTNCIIATGSKPIELPFLPFDEKKIVSSTGALSFSSVPNELIIIGAGIIGLELGSVWARLGSKVSFIELLPVIAPSLDHTLSEEMQKIMQKQNLQFHLSTKVTGAQVGKEKIVIHAEQNQEKKDFSADAVLVAIGRKPFTKDLQLEKIGIQTDKKGFIETDRNFCTSHKHIFAIGDVVKGPMLAHKASEDGIACVEYICGLKPSIQYLSVPSVAYTHPEAAGVGFTEKQLTERKIEYVTGTFPFKANSRARCVSEEKGLVKILADKSSLQILGVHILSANASELIGEATLAIYKKMHVHDLADCSHAHPTLSEAIKEAALSISKKAIHI